MFIIGERYKVISHPYNIFITCAPFYGTCQHFTIHENGRFCRVQFINMSNLDHEPIPYEKWCLIDLNNKYDLMFMRIMKPSLKDQIRQPKIPTLANMCRVRIPYETRIELQGTYIDDVINDVV